MIQKLKNLYQDYKTKRQLAKNWDKVIYMLAKLQTKDTELTPTEGERK